MAKKEKETLLDLLPKDAIDVDTTTMEEAMNIYNKQKNQNISVWKEGNRYNNKENPFGRMSIREFMSPNKEGVRPYDILKSKITEEVLENNLSTNPVKDVMKYTRYVTGDIVRSHLERHDPKNDLLDRLPTNKPSDSISKAILGTEPGKTRAEIGVTGNKQNLRMFFEELHKQTDRPALIPMRNAIILNANTGLRPNAVLDLRLSEYDRETGSITLVPELDAGELQEAQEQGKKSKKRRGVSKKGFGRDKALTVTIPLSEDAVQAIEDQIAYNEKNSKYNIAKENNPHIFVKAGGGKVETKDANDVLKKVRVKGTIIYPFKLGVGLGTLSPTKEDFIEAGLPENTKIGKSGMSLFRNMHTIVSIGARIPNDDLEFLQGRAYTSGNAKRLGYATRVPGEFFPEERDLANKVGNFYREATGRPLVSTDLTIKIDDEDIQADNKQFTTKFDEKTPDQLSDEKLARTRKAAETEVYTKEKSLARLEELRNIPEDQKTDIDKIEQERLNRSLKIKPEATARDLKFLDNVSTEEILNRPLKPMPTIIRKGAKDIITGVAAGAATLFGPGKFLKAADWGSMAVEEAFMAKPASGDRIQSYSGEHGRDFSEEELLQSIQSDRTTPDLTPVSDIASKELRRRIEAKRPIAEIPTKQMRPKWAREYISKYEPVLQDRAEDLAEEYSGFALKQLP